MPYGYDAADAEARYDIVYLMHGWGGAAGEYFNIGTLKNTFGRLVKRGDMKPAILVSAAFYHEGSGRDFSASVRQFRAFHEGFENALMPAVEGKYHTCAKSASAEDLKASRDHRAFCGFSLGAVTTRLEFCYDYIRYFAPMSGSCWYYGTYGDFQIQRNVDFIEQLVEENDLDERGYFIYHAVGTNDTVKSQSIDMADEMLARDIFTPEHYMFSASALNLLRGSIASRFCIAALALPCLRLNLTSRLRLQGWALAACQALPGQDFHPTILRTPNRRTGRQIIFSRAYQSIKATW